MRTYVLAGASSRGLGMYAEPITHSFTKTALLAGIYDPNPVRAQFVSERCGGVPVFSDFDSMLAQTRPDCVIVTTVDRYHHEYIIRGLDAGCDVISEKPMTIDDEKCRAILAAEQRSGKKLIVTFNYRFTPFTTRIKELLRGGAIGKILSVDFEWLLDTSHGADYFRRWHAHLENSGGLLVHKATHHFDMINWWLEDEPKSVFAKGELKFYGPKRAERGENCRTCAHQTTCEFYWDATADPLIKSLYLDAEQADGYLRDRCVFRPEINIYDTMAVTAAYQGGAYLSYSLVAHSPYEGWRVAINGTGGRLEAEDIESGFRAAGPTLQCRIFNRRGEMLSYDIPKAVGGHGGSDGLLQQRLFGDKPIPDPLGHMAGSRAGAMSILIGIAANQSILTGKAVEIQDLLSI
jgi:predicted dehydrogenase